MRLGFIKRFRNLTYGFTNPNLYENAHTCKTSISKSHCSVLSTRNDKLALVFLQNDANVQFRHNLRIHYIYHYKSKVNILLTIPLNLGVTVETRPGNTYHYTISLFRFMTALRHPSRFSTNIYRSAVVV